MRVGIVGLPNVGKSTLFNALTKASALAENYPFCTIEPNVGRAAVSDERLTKLAELISPEKVVPATVEFVDIAGLVKGASRGEGLGNQFLGHIRDVDAIVEVVRCFEDPDVAHVSAKLDPTTDIETIELELILADLEVLNRRQDKIERQKKSGDPKYIKAYDYLATLRHHLEAGGLARGAPGIPAGLESELGDLNLLTAKPLLMVANVGDTGLTGQAADYWHQVKIAADQRGAAALWLSAQLEVELWELPPDERTIFLREIGLDQLGLHRLVQESFKLLNLITFFTTTGNHEVRAWPVKRGTLAAEAAGKIHSDMEKGFIRAEVVSYDDLMAAGSFAAVPKLGLMRLQGRDYQVQDGDIIHFRFNV
ncbi:MAG: redox-regulated ATPase YchF [bacterium]